MGKDTNARAVELLHREYARWRDADGPSDATAIGAMGAVANVLAALLVPHAEAGVPPIGVVRPAIFHTWGQGWLGLIRVRVLLHDGGEKTFWHLFLPFNLSVGVTLPGPVVDRLSLLRGRTS